MTERYDPDAEMKARALAEVAEAAKASTLPVRRLAAYRSATVRAEARRELLRRLADGARRRFLDGPA